MDNNMLFFAALCSDLDSLPGLLFWPSAVDMEIEVESRIGQLERFFASLGVQSASDILLDA